MRSLEPNELLTRMKVRITFSLFRFVHAAGIYYMHVHLSHAGIHYSGGAHTRINFHNIWQVDTPRGRTDPASSNDHLRSPYLLT